MSAWLHQVGYKIFATVATDVTGRRPSGHLSVALTLKMRHPSLDSLLLGVIRVCTATAVVGPPVIPILAAAWRTRRGCGVEALNMLVAGAAVTKTSCSHSFLTQEPAALDIGLHIALSGPYPKETVLAAKLATIP